MAFITFSPDGGYLMTCSIDGTTHTWHATNGNPVNTPESSGISVSDNNMTLAFNMERGWCSEEIDNALLQWFPVNNADFGYWAYIDGKLVKRDKTGLTTIMDVREVLHTRRRMEAST
jgi:WD40 repeat protein